MSNKSAPNPATQCPHCGAWIFTRLYYRQHVQECVNRTPGMKDLSDGALEPFPYQQSDRVNIIRDTPAIVHYPELNEIRGFTKPIASHKRRTRR